MTSENWAPSSRSQIQVAIKTDLLARTGESENNSV